MAEYRQTMEGLDEVCEMGEPMDWRHGGPQGDDETDEERQKREERDRKKAEVRARLEAANKNKKAKKGFLTPERKKKLRKLLMMKAAEDLKQQQLLKEQQRQKVLAERIIKLPDVDSMNDHAALAKLAQQMWDALAKSEDNKYDLEYQVRQKDFEINELTIAVNDLRGKFVKPTLKKVSKYDSKKTQEKPKSLLEKLGGSALKKVEKKDKFLEELKASGKHEHEEAAAEFEKMKAAKKDNVDFRSGLKSSGVNKFALEEEEEKAKPEWADKGEAEEEA